MANPQPQLLADFLLNVRRRLGSVRGHDQFLPPKKVQYWLCLGVIIAQPLADRLGGIVGTGHQGPFANVANPRDGRMVEDEIVIQATLRTQTPIDDALENDAVRHVDLNNGVDIVAFEEELRLMGVGGKPSRMKP